MNIRAFQKSDLHNVIDFLEKSPFTNWTEETWLENSLTAILAFDKKKMIGAFPLKPRSLNIGDSEYIDILWATSFFIDNKYKQYGLGYFMCKKIKEIFQSKFKGVFNYNSPDDETYDWYLSLGHHSFLEIIAYNKNVINEKNNMKFNYYDSHQSINQIKHKLYNCFISNNSCFGGSPLRHKNFWDQHINYSYHRNHYKYSIIIIDNEIENNINGYALLGETQIRDNIKRFDILEQSIDTNKISIDILYKSIMDIAYKNNLEEIRIQSSAEDSFNKWFIQQRFTQRWKFDILGYIFDPIECFFNKIKSNDYFNSSFKITIISDNNIVKILGKGNNEIELFISNIDINNLVLGRLDLLSAINNGKIIIYKNNKSLLEFLSSIFIKQKWKFHHIDYI